MTAEAEIDDSEAAGEQAPKRKLSKRLLIIIGAGVGVLLAAGAGSYFLLFSGATDPAAEQHEPAAPESFIFNLPAMTVNLNNDEGGEAFMKLTVALEVASEEVMAEIQPRMAKVIDAFQVYLRELRKSDLEGSPASIG